MFLFACVASKSNQNKQMFCTYTRKTSF